MSAEYRTGVSGVRDQLGSLGREGVAVGKVRDGVIRAWAGLDIGKKRERMIRKRPEAQRWASSFSKK